MNVNDFLVSLGFDTKKIESQIKGVEKKLEKMAASVGIKASAQKIKQVKETAEKAQKVELSYAEKLQATKERLAKAAEKRELERQVKASTLAADSHVVAFQKAQKQRQRDEIAIEKAIARRRMQENKRQRDIEAVQRKKQIASDLNSAARVAQAVRALTNPEKNPQLKAMSSYYRNLEKAATSSYSEKLKGDTLSKRASGLADYVAREARSRGVGDDITGAFKNQIINSNTIVDANRYARILDNISMKIDALDSAGKKKLLNIVSSGQIDQLQRFNAELAQSHRQMNRAKYQAFSLANAQDALGSSTRNLIREYASLYAAFAGVMYIKEQAKAMDGVAAGMTAVSKDAQEVAHNIAFIKEEALKNGLAIGEAAKSYVKLKAAIGDKVTLQETEQMFQSLTKAGVVFQLSQDDMTGVIKAVSQMFAKGKIQAKFFGPLRRNTYRKTSLIAGNSR